MREIAGKRVLVTGAASGIGRGAALAFAAEGSTLLLADIDEAGLARVRGEIAALGAPCRTYHTDVTDIGSVKAMAAAIDEEFGGIDVLVNVAGVAVCGSAMHIPLDDWHWIMDVNLWRPIHTMLTFVPGMIDRGAGGHIVNVASVAGLVGVAAIIPYTTTKFALVGLSEALRTELRGNGIGVTAFCPGLTNTPIATRARVHGFAETAYAKASTVLKALGKSPVRTGRLIVKAVKNDKALVVTTGLGHLMYQWHRLTPGLFRAAAGASHPLLGRFIGMPDGAGGAGCGDEPRQS